MPKRSNSFQETVYLVKKCLEGDGVVTESDMLVDRQTGDEREVDVTVKSAISGHQVTVSLECVDHSRRASVEWVERMAGKHAALPTNLLVLVSKSGFSQAAIRKADSLGIVAISMEESPDAVEERLRVRLQNLRLLSFNLTVREVHLDLESPSGEIIKSVPAIQGSDVYLGGGDRVGDLGAVIGGYMAMPEVGGKMFEDGTSEKPPKSFLEFTKATIELTPSVIIEDVDHPLYVRIVEDDKLYRIVRAIVTTDLKTADEPIDFKHGALGETIVSWGTSKLVDGDCVLVATKAADGGVVIAVKEGAKMGTARMIED